MEHQDTVVRYKRNTKRVGENNRIIVEWKLAIKDVLCRKLNAAECNFDGLKIE